MKKGSLLIVGACLFLGIGPVQAADIAAGQATYAACVSCHGPAGQGMAIFPSIAGQEADYISTRLTQYRAGEQIGPNTALMAPMAAGLSDTDIANLAAYISTSFR